MGEEEGTGGSLEAEQARLGHLAEERQAVCVREPEAARGAVRDQEGPVAGGLQLMNVAALRAGNGLADERRARDRAVAGPELASQLRSAGVEEQASAIHGAEERREERRRESARDREGARRSSIGAPDHQLQAADPIEGDAPRRSERHGASARRAEDTQGDRALGRAVRDPESHEMLVVGADEDRPVPDRQKAGDALRLLDAPLGQVGDEPGGSGLGEGRKSEERGGHDHPGEELRGGHA